MERAHVTNDALAALARQRCHGTVPPSHRRLHPVHFRGPALGFLRYKGRQVVDESRRPIERRINDCAVPSRRAYFRNGHRRLAGEDLGFEGAEQRS